MMRILKNLIKGIAALIIVLTLLWTNVKAASIPTASHILSKANSAVPASTDLHGTDVITTVRFEDGLKGSKSGADRANATKSDEEEKLEFLNPFMAFPFFPFHFPDLKRDVNSTEKIVRIEKDKENLSGKRRKPFLFIDFAFNIREIPPKNQTEESGSAALASSFPKELPEKSESKVDPPIDAIDDDWPFFDDSPLVSPDMDEFLPKSDFLFFDFPFHKKQSKKFIRNKRDMTKPVVKSDLNFLVDIFDEAISRTKNEMERPLWDLMREAGKNVRRESKEDTTKQKGGGKYEPRGMDVVKRSPYESSRNKNPVILGKVVKIGEIHFGEDYPKGKKKRRTTSATGKKGNHGIQESSIELIQMNEPLRSDDFPKYLEYSPFHTSLKDIFHRIHQDHQESAQKESKFSHKAEDSKILDLMTQWDRREMEQMAKASTRKSETAQPYSHKEQETGRSRLRVSNDERNEGFRYVGHMSNGRYRTRGGSGFEVLKPQTSFARPKRQESGANEETATSSKEEIRRNITQVLGQFFSMTRRLGDSKPFYQDKENPEIEYVNWPELEDVPRSGSYINAVKKLRRARDTEGEQEKKPHLVADLNYLFLTVTLPTMFAFTLLLVVCFFNLRLRGWLCTKLFKPRHVYVVEGDVEKAEKTPVTAKNEKSYQEKKVNKDEDSLQPEERREKHDES